MSQTKEEKREYDRKRYDTILKDQRKEDYLENREQKIKYQKMYRLKNLEHIKEYNEEYYLKNMEKIKEYRSKPETKKLMRKYENHRYKTDANFKLKKVCRNRVNRALKGLTKSASTMELIGCTIEELRRHIESLFEPWMTWENHGLWDIDHIEACAKFDMLDPEQQRACFNWSNLQPMEHIANIKKGAR
jgi:hypothetical protein